MPPRQGTTKSSRTAAAADRATGSTSPFGPMLPAPAQPRPALRPRPVAVARATDPSKLYWDRAWTVATALTIVLVVRLLETIGPLAALHPAVLGALVSFALL